MTRILVSACLLGQPVRYDGRAKTVRDKRIELWTDQGLVVPLCPEMAAGLPVPRPPAEIATGHSGEQVLSGQGAVRDHTGHDVTDMFVAAANIAVKAANERDCKLALLMDRSPSCGSRMVYSGAFDGHITQGRGLVAQALMDAGVQVFSEGQLDELELALSQLGAK